MTIEVEAILLLGSNLGDRKHTIITTCNLIEKKIGEIVMESSYYESEAWGYNDKKKYLNRAVIVNTIHSASTLLSKILDIEKSMGRKRINSNNYEARIIDIDILFYGDQILISKNLTIPHKFLHKRKFTLRPLQEIAPDFIHPKLNKSITQLLDKCEDDLHVELYEKSE